MESKQYKIKNVKEMVDCTNEANLDNFLKDLKEQLLLHNVSQQRELLKWMNEQELYKQTPDEIEVLLLAYNFESL
tara:strand:- start:639 stop:863 length:225 start_codon:yes stop_codon:yes gene_type:complete